MSKLRFAQLNSEGRIRPSRFRARNLLPMLLALAFAAFAFHPGVALGHAEFDHSLPEPNSTVTNSPPKVEIWFTEEATDESTIKVIGPDGSQVDLGDSALDLYDVNRQHVTVSLSPNLPSGNYTVQWKSISGEDGDEATGGFAFAIEVAATPEASPAASPVGSPVGTPSGSPTADESSVSASLVTEESVPTESTFDSHAFYISVGAGLLAAAGIYLFWRFVRPKNPKF